MNAPELLLEIHRRGAAVELVEPGQLRVRPGRAVADLVEELRARKAELLAIVRDDRCPRCAAWVAEARQRDPRAERICRSCPGWTPMFRRVIPAEVFEAHRAAKREYRRLVAAGVDPEVAATEADRVAESILAGKGRDGG